MHKVDGLDGLRRQIDRLDDQIVDLFGERFALLRAVAAYKRPRDIPVVIPERIDEVVERCVARGARHGLDAQMLRDIYRRLIDEACAVEERALAEQRRSPVPATAIHD
jgi:chorismate mutase-like protein